MGQHFQSLFSSGDWWGGGVEWPFRTYTVLGLTACEKGSETFRCSNGQPIIIIYKFVNFGIIYIHSYCRLHTKTLKGILLYALWHDKIMINFMQIQRKRWVLVRCQEFRLTLIANAAHSMPIYNWGEGLKLYQIFIFLQCIFYTYFPKLCTL